MSHLIQMRQLIFYFFLLKRTMEELFTFKNILIMNCLLQTCSFLLHKTLIDPLESYGLLVDYCDVLVSCLDSHSGSTHSLQIIHWWASDVMLHLKGESWPNGRKSTHNQKVASSNLGPAVGGGQECTALSITQWGGLEQSTKPPTAPRVPQHKCCPLLRVCVHGECVFTAVCVHLDG